VKEFSYRSKHDLAAVAAAMAAVAVTSFARVAAAAMGARRLGLASASCNSDCSAMAVAEVEAAKFFARVGCGHS
jgi:hypothetical protein